LVARLCELAAVKRRHGYRRSHVLRRREGYAVNRKRVVTVLERLVEQRGAPLSIAVDHGPEFERQALNESIRAGIGT
jgi:hypothetical protein